MIRTLTGKSALFAMLVLTGTYVERADVRGTSQVAPVRVVLDTEKGPIEIEVDVAHAPVTAANFLKYVDAGAYDGGFFHRTVRPDTETRTDYPIQVIQASRAEAKPGFTPVALERTNVTGLKHLDGTVSMARSGPDTATSDFFICLGAQPELDFGGKRNADGQGFAAFGRIVSGMDTVKRIQAAPTKGVASPQTLEPRITITKASRR
jgi:peptidyl-prolyl cis-trans isomerase A (cyclophilin A)